MIDGWEYHVLRLDAQSPSLFATSPDVDQDRFAEALNALGAQGWELASTLGVDDYRGASRSFLLVFKRRVAS